MKKLLIATALITSFGAFAHSGPHGAAPQKGATSVSAEVPKEATKITVNHFTNKAGEHAGCQLSFGNLHEGGNGLIVRAFKSGNANILTFLEQSEDGKWTTAMKGYNNISLTEIMAAMNESDNSKSLNAGGEFEKTEVQKAIAEFKKCLANH